MYKFKYNYITIFITLNLKAIQNVTLYYLNLILRIGVIEIKIRTKVIF